MASSGDESPPKKVDEIAKPLNEGQQDSRMESSKLSSPSVFVNSEPLREDQVENAVKFLSHRRVRDSPVIHRRSFLEKKGLTKEEIDEAFRRVPDPSPSAHATNVNQDGQVRSTSNVQQPGPVQTLQPSAATPGAITTSGTLSGTRFHWYHAVMAVGLLAVSGAGTAVFIKNAMVPRLKAWIRKVAREEEEEDLLKENNSKPSLAEEAAAAAKAAAAAASDVAKTSQELLKSRYEEKKYFEDFMLKLDVQVQEMKSMSTAIHKLEGRNYTPNGAYLNDQEDNRESTAYHKQAYANGKSDHDSHSARSSSPPVSADPSIAPHPKSYMEIMAMIQRGERPSNIREIDDQPPNPNQQISNPRLPPRTKPWEVGQVQSNSTQVLQTQLSGEGLSSKVQQNGVTYQFNEESNAPWWERKNARITEIENEDEFKDNKGQAPEQQVRRTWVPPQPPSVVMPEAAEAIRRPKSSVKKEEQLAAGNETSLSTDVTDELERVTKVGESESAVETNGGGSGLSSSEIHEELDGRVE